MWRSSGRLVCCNSADLGKLVGCCCSSSFDSRCSWSTALWIIPIRNKNSMVLQFLGCFVSLLWNSVLQCWFKNFNNSSVLLLWFKSCWSVFLTKQSFCLHLCFLSFCRAAWLPVRHKKTLYFDFKTCPGSSKEVERQTLYDTFDASNLQYNYLKIENKYIGAQCLPSKCSAVEV